MLRVSKNLHPLVGKGPTSGKKNKKKTPHLSTSGCPSRFENTCSINLVDGTSAACLQSSVPIDSLPCPSSSVEGKLKSSKLLCRLRGTNTEAAASIRPRSSEQVVGLKTY